MSSVFVFSILTQSSHTVFLGSCVCYFSVFSIPLVYYPVLSQHLCPVLSCFTLPCSVLSHPVLFHHHCPVLLCSTTFLSCLLLSCPTSPPLMCPVSPPISNPALSLPLPYLVLFCLISSLVLSINPAFPHYCVKSVCCLKAFFFLLFTYITFFQHILTCASYFPLPSNLSAIAASYCSVFFFPIQAG